MSTRSPFSNIQNSFFVHALGAYKNSNIYSSAPALLKLRILLLSWLVPSMVIRQATSYGLRYWTMRRMGMTERAEVLACFEIDGVIAVPLDDTKGVGNDNCCDGECLGTLAHTQRNHAAQNHKRIKCSVEEVDGVVIHHLPENHENHSTQPQGETPSSLVSANLRPTFVEKAFVFIQAVTLLLGSGARWQCGQELRHTDLMTTIGAAINITVCIATYPRPSINSPIRIKARPIQLNPWLEYGTIMSIIWVALILFMYANIWKLDGAARTVAIIAGSIYCVGVTLEGILSDGKVQWKDFSLLRQWNFVISAGLLCIVLGISYWDTWARGESEQTCWRNLLPFIF